MINIIGKPTPEQKKTVEELIKKVPNNKYVINFTNDFSKTYKGQPINQTSDNIDGYKQIKINGIIGGSSGQVDDVYEIQINPNLDINSFKNIFAHELGESLAQNIPDNLFKTNRTTGNYYNFQKMGEKILNKSETFSDHFADYLLNNKTYSERYPEENKYFNKFLNNNMAKSIKDYTINPDFYTKNAGQYLEDKPTKKTFLVNPTGLQEVAGMPVNTKPGQYITFDLVSGLIDKDMMAKGSWENPEGWKYLNATPSAENAWLGKGSAGSPEVIANNGQPIKSGFPEQNDPTFNIATTGKSDLTLEKLLKDPKVIQDKGVNGITMAKWLQGNASLIPKLASLGYTTTDLINEAYSQTRYNKSAFSGDMMTLTAEQNRAQNKQQNYSPATPSPSASASPDDIKNDPEYQNLSDFGKTLIDTLTNLYSAKDTQSQAQYQEALDIATSLADPYKALMLGFAKDSIPDEFRIEKLSTEEKLRQNQERLTEISELMKGRKGDLLIEDQQVLDTLARDYENKITDMQDSVSNAGLTYSSKRSDLERFIKQQNMDLVQSTQRSAGQKIRNLEQSKREAEKQETLLKEAGNATLKSIARGAEAKIGTSEFNKLTGMTDLDGSQIKPVGGQNGLESYGGDIEQQRRNLILEQASKFNQYQNPNELKTLFNL